MRCEILQKMCRSRAKRPTKPELELGLILDRVCPNEYTYTGDFSVVIGGKCPDYTNKNGQKKVVEMYGSYWHDVGTEEIRISKFKEYGFDCLIVWDYELKNPDNLTGKILEFNRR